MAELRALPTQVRASNRLPTLAFASVGIVMLGVLAAGSSAAHGAPAGPRVAASAPAGSKGELTGVAAVPHSSDVWAIGSVGTVDNARFFVGHRHNGHWQKVATPKLGGRYGRLTAVAVGSAKSVWLGGARQLKAGSTQTVPAIWRLTGKRFVAQKLSALSDLSDAVDSISASSATNAWAVGGLYPGQTVAQVAFHWNGKKWSAVTVPSGYSQTLYDVSTSSPSNAWALRSDYLGMQDVFVHWNGKVWTVGDPAPAGITLGTVATSSPKLAYATGVGTAPTGGSRSVILKFNGSKWSNVALPKAGVHSGLGVVTLHGKSAWALGAGSTKPVILHSTGGAWKAEGSPGKDYGLVSISAGSATRAYAVGYYVIPGSGNPTKTFFETFGSHSGKGEPSKF